MTEVFRMDSILSYFNFMMRDIYAVHRQLRENIKTVLIIGPSSSRSLG